MIIFLIGMMGSGKSSIGAKLAKELEIDFFDLDEVISHQTGKTISQIFEKKGEAFFRQLESEMLRKFKKEDDLILACGGGTPCFFDNLSWMMAHGIVLYLNVPINVLTERLMKTDMTGRPLLGGSKMEIESRLASILDERKFFYEKAHFEVDADRSQEEITSDLVYYLKRFKKGF
jgi:shikimate kinase